MFCKNCGKELKDGAVFCEECGAKVESTAFDGEPNTRPVAQTVVVQQTPVTEETLPAQYRPLGPWAYFGLALLFSIPIAGFVLLIVFSCSRKNINRRNFARSYWCGLIIVAAVFLTYAILAMTGVLGYSFAEWIRNLTH